MCPHTTLNFSTIELTVLQISSARQWLSKSLPMSMHLILHNSSYVCILYTYIYIYFYTYIYIHTYIYKSMMFIPFLTVDVTWNENPWRVRSSLGTMISCAYHTCEHLYVFAYNIYIYTYIYLKLSLPIVPFFQGKPLFQGKP